MQGEHDQHRYEDNQRQVDYRGEGRREEDWRRSDDRSRYQGGRHPDYESNNQPGRSWGGHQGYLGSHADEDRARGWREDNSRRDWRDERGGGWNREENRGGDWRDRERGNWSGSSSRNFDERREYGRSDPGQREDYGRGEDQRRGDDWRPRDQDYQSREMGYRGGWSGDNRDDANRSRYEDRQHGGFRDQRQDNRRPAERDWSERDQGSRRDEWRGSNEREGERGRNPGRHTDYGDNDQYRPRGSSLYESRAGYNDRNERDYYSQREQRR